MRSKIWIVFLAIVLYLSVIPAKTVYAEETEYMHVENFSADYQLKGLFGSCEEYFQVGNWNIGKAELTLFYTSTTLVREEISDFTVMLNGEPIYSQKVPLTTGETKKLTIILPERLLREGVNSVRVESYIRTNEDDPCVDDISGASWMVIEESSYTSISYRPASTCHNVADVYKQLTSIEGLENEMSAIFMPESPTENELTAAAYLLSGISSNAAANYNNLLLINSNSVKDIEEYAYCAYIAEYDKLPVNIRYLLNEEQKEAAKTDAVIAYVKSNATQLLVITGSDEQALQNAGRLFGNQTSMEQTKRQWRKVAASEDVSVAADIDDMVYLTETGSYVSGPFRQTASFNIVMNANQSIAANSEVTIYFRYAQNLDFERSLVTVYIADTPIGSKKLERESANKDSLTVNIPNNLNITGNFILQVTFDLEMKDLICDVRRQDMPWAYVTNESTITLRTEEVPWLLFDYYPTPFIQEGRINDVTMILPSQESDEDREAMRQIMLTLGRYMTDNAGTLKVRRADHMGDLTNTNVISIGCLEDNPIVRQLNDRLYFQFSSGGTTIRSNEKMKIEPNYGAVLGTAQLLYSPYSTEQNALLVVSGITKEGMLQAVNYLGSVENNWQIYGDGFVTDGEMINCYRFGPDNSKQDTVLSKLTQQSGTMTLLVTGFCVLILMSISLILIWKKHRR